MHEYVMAFDGDNEKVKPGAHPAEIVPYHLGSSNAVNNGQHMKSLELWFAGYQYKRSGMIYKSCASVVSHSVFLGPNNWRAKICCTVKNMMTIQFPDQLVLLGAGSSDGQGHAQAANHSLEVSW